MAVKSGGIELLQGSNGKTGGGTLEVAHSQKVQVDQTLRIGSWESLIYGSS